MKKHLIAAAVAGAFAVPAMAQVTVSGNLNINALNDTKVTTQAGAAAATSIKTSTTAFDNGWTASQISFSGTEDLGGGLSASFTVNTGLGNGASTFADRDRNLALSGGFGTVRFGRFIPAAAMGYHGFSGSASTSAGSIYALGAGGFAQTAAEVTAEGLAGTTDRFGARASGSFERNNNNLQYSTPNIAGFVVNVNYGVNSTDRSNPNRAGKAQVTQNGIGLAYTAGPLSAGIGMNNRKVEREQDPGGATAAFCMTANPDGDTWTSVAPGVACPTGTTRVGGAAAEARRTRKGDLDWVGASYNFGVARLSATHVKRKDTEQTGAAAQTTLADMKVNSVGVSVPVGALTLAGSVYNGKDKATVVGTDDTKLSGHQVTAQYALSKRTMVYALISENSVKRDGANTAGQTRKETQNMLGVMHSF